MGFKRTYILGILWLLSSDFCVSCTVMKSHWQIICRSIPTWVLAKNHNSFFFLWDNPTIGRHVMSNFYYYYRRKKVPHGIWGGKSKKIKISCYLIKNFEFISSSWSWFDELWWEVISNSCSDSEYLIEILTGNWVFLPLLLLHQCYCCCCCCCCCCCSCCCCCWWWWWWTIQRIL